MKKHIHFLSDDKLKGRAPDSEGDILAEKYIIDRFEAYNLLPYGDKMDKIIKKGDKMIRNSYTQAFSFQLNSNPHGNTDPNTPKENGRNIVGFLDNGAANTIVIGAHYDHLGDDGRGSSLDANPAGKIHNGADDNASGVAGLLELARIYSSNPTKEPYNFLFIAFSAEEAGLIGSKFFVNNPTVPLEKMQVMLNMDMVGRLNDSTMKLMVYGVGTSPIFVPMLSNFNNKPFRLVTDSSGVGPSDHTSFYLKNVPVLHFFTGQHADYHKPTDDYSKINFKGEAKVLAFMCQLIDLISASPKLSFTPTKVKAAKSNGFKVSMGVMPDYAFDGKGLRVDGVTDGKPAQKAGMKAGDIIVKLGDTTVANIYEYMDALNHFERGVTTAVEVLRDKKTIVLTVTF